MELINYHHFTCIQTKPGQILLLSFHLFVTAFAQSSHPAHRDLVDLGYAKHVPTWVNISTAGAEILNYDNIRYAHPPLGQKRFRKPVTPPPRQRGIQDGNLTSWKTDCLSAAPIGMPFPLLNGSTWGSEDCPYLNVVVPKGAREGDKLPVLHWVVGSAYAFDGKDWTGFGLNALGNFNRPKNLTDQFIIVTHNYGLGVPGWLPKPDEDMNGNLGVWDTLAAVEWTKKYICKFGGDPNNITMIGQSAGAGIITWLLLAKEGKLELPFDQAWISSPALPPRKDLERSRSVYEQVLNVTGCDSVRCLRRVSEGSMHEVNENIFLESPSSPGGGSLGAGVGLTPTVDGELLSDLPANAFANGKFNKKIKQVIGSWLSSDRDMPARFPEVVRANIPNVSNESLATLSSRYPYPLELPEKLAWDWTTDVVFGCSAGNIAGAYGNKIRRFVFTIPRPRMVWICRTSSSMITLQYL
ncbi:Carboxylesterase family-domain-containing protein [Lophiotrema nucula]|uniref:Carboxylesterase family-domain-containing protein n=1 Tax=Lophiotrema nucula TaxID=690887 RepID=A0A6A5ZI32_9PLEO|nr:Carboxylesterase family-domain-containing protein [Lophiotrema nucula]